MGVDYYTCDHCKRTFSECEDYVSCDCGKRWCCDTCAENDGYENRENEIDDEYEDTEDLISCRFCRGEDVEDSDLLNFMLKHFNVDRSVMFDLYYEGKK